MLKRYLANNKGVALVMVVAVMLILCTLGLGIVSYSFTNLKVSKADKEAKLEFYMAESGLEQAYEVAADSIKKATNVANEKVNKEIEKFIEAERIKVVNGGTSEYIDDRLNIKEEKLNELLADDKKAENKAWLKIYKKEYKNYLNNKLVTELKKDANYKPIDNKVAKRPDIYEVKVKSDKLFGDSDEVKSGELMLKSKLVDKNSEKVEMTFKIEVPDKLPDTILNYKDITKTEDNPLWDYALVAGAGDIWFGGYNGGYEGKDTTINGNVYAYNNIRFPRPSDLITINGNVSVNNQVIHQDGDKTHTSNYSELTINGNLYTNEMVINSGCTNDQIIINGNTFTSGKIELLGKHSKIDISKGWYKTTSKSKVNNNIPGSSSFKKGSTPTVTDDHRVLTAKERKKFSNVDDYLDLANVKEVGKVGENFPVDGEILCINKDSSKTVYLIGNNICATINDGIRYNVKGGPVKGIIITAGRVEVHGDVNFTGLIVSKGNAIYFAHDQEGTAGRVKTITADREYVKNKAEQLELTGENPFKFIRSSSVGLGDSATLAPYQKLISISDWQKL